MKRRTYDLKININDRQIERVVIDSHYEIKHSGTIDDEIILALVKQLDGAYYRPVGRKGKYEYFVRDQMILNERTYRMVWLLEDDELYVGVVNAYRRK